MLQDLYKLERIIMSSQDNLNVQAHEIVKRDLLEARTELDKIIKAFEGFLDSQSTR